MWMLDRYKHPINLSHILGLYVDTQDGGYVVKANNADQVFVAQFVDNNSGTVMVQADADALLIEIRTALGTINPTDL